MRLRKLLDQLLEPRASRIINEFKGVNRCGFDITQPTTRND